MADFPLFFFFFGLICTLRFYYYFGSVRETTFLSSSVYFLVCIPCAEDLAYLPADTWTIVMADNRRHLSMGFLFCLVTWGGMYNRRVERDTRHHSSCLWGE